ncbi:phage tail protein [Spirosoma litoris]
MTEYLAIIQLFGGNFAPRNFLMCNGQLLNISTNTALFALLGTTYGGNGTTTFALPDLRGKVCIGTGQGPGLANYVQGQQNVAQTQTLISSNLPSHTHVVTGTLNPGSSSDTGDSANPIGNVSSSTGSRKNYGTTNDSPRFTGVTGTAGNSQPFSVMQPYQAVNFIICVSGLFPSRN